MEPEYPADLFTTCLTTPIPMALRWFVTTNRLSMEGVDPESVRVQQLGLRLHKI